METFKNIESIFSRLINQYYAIKKSPESVALHNSKATSVQQGSMMIYACMLMTTVCFIQCVSAHSTIKSNLDLWAFKDLTYTSHAVLRQSILYGGVCLFFVFENKSPSLLVSQENTAMLVLL